MKFHQKIPEETVLLIEGVHDLLVSSSPVELWQSWGQPEIWRLPHGHISTALTALMPGLPGRVLRWLSPRLDIQSQLQSVHSALP